MMLSKIKEIYSSNPKLQLFIFLFAIFLLIGVAYWFTSQNNEKYKNLGSKGYKITPKEQPKKEKKQEPKKKDFEKTKRIESTPSPAKVTPPPSEEKKEQNQQRLQEIQKKRFDNDIEKQFEFLNKF